MRGSLELDSGVGVRVRAPTPRFACGRCQRVVLRQYLTPDGICRSKSVCDEELRLLHAAWAEVDAEEESIAASR